ncbi:MAG: SRPBCC family protein [Nitriliruptorales bacterium]
MPQIMLTEHIEAPVEEVFAYLTDPTNEIEWISSAREREIVEGDGGKGTRFRAVDQFLAKRIDFVYEVTEHDAPNRYAYRVVEGPFPGLIDVTLTSEEGGTTLTFDANADAGFKGFFGKLTEPIVTRVFERDTSADLAKLKALVEARS